MTTILTINPSRALDLNGFSVPDARATFTNSGTTRRRTVYADAECSIPHPSPLVADGAGVFPPIYDTGDGNAAVTVTDASGAVLAGFPIDPVPAVSTDQTGASGISFDPTPEIPEKTVQAAIERVQENMAQPLLDYGLGVSGSGPLLSNIENTAIPSGVYRFNGTTTGTFPSGVTAAAGGTVQVWRSTANAALMTITQAGARRQHVRALSEGSWGGWAYIMQSADTATDAVWAAGSSAAPAIPSPKAIRAAINADSRVWTSVTGSRTTGTSYRNTTGRTIEVSISGDAGGSPATAQVSENGSAWVNVGRFGEAGQLEASATFSVPDRNYYRVIGNLNFNWWSELR